MTPVGKVGDAIVLGPERRGDLFVTQPGALRVDGAVVPVHIHRLGPHQEYLADFFTLRARTLATLGGAGTPRLLRAYADAGRLAATVEEWVGEVPLRRLLAVSKAKGRLPTALALHVGRSLAAIWERLERLGTWQQLTLDPMEIHVDYAGRVRAEAEIFPGPREHNHGAAAALLTGSFELMAPEQVRGLPLTRQTPMFGLGLLMLEALTATPVFDRTRPFELLQRIATERFSCARTGRTDLPAALVAVIDRCLSIEPAQRAPTWADLMASFDAARNDVGVFGAPELAAQMIALFGEGYRDHSVRVDALALLDFDQPLSGPAVTPWEPELLTGQTLPTPVDVPALNLDVVDFGHDGRAMLAAGTRLAVDRRPVTHAEYARFLIATGRPVALPPPALADEPVTQVGFRDATAYAQWAGKRLPTNVEWERAVRQLGPDALGVGAVWEWTSTAAENGLIVRGGRWRNAAHVPASATNLSWELDASADVGFRCVGDLR